LTCFAVVTDFASICTFVTVLDWVGFIEEVSISAIVETLTFSQERFDFLVTFSTDFEVSVQTFFADGIGTFETSLTVFDVSVGTFVYTLNIVE
jgi:hypothetical protein